ncbi:hypothetical protein ACP275_12G130400 [Erythranthe tilingii]
MTVTRSRGRSVAAKISKPLDSEIVVVEPATPAKNFELLNQSSNTANSSPSSSSSVQKCGHPELGLESIGNMVSESGTALRRSVRLAKKVAASDCLENVDSVSGKRKKVVGSSVIGEFGVRGLERRDLDLELGVDMVTDKEEFENGESLAKVESSNDMETPLLEAVNSGRRKRKLCSTVKSLGYESGERTEVESVFLSLRSGKKVVKREMEDRNGCAGKSVEGTDNSKESDIPLSGRIPEEIKCTKSEASIEKNENDSPKGRRYSGAEKGKGKVGSVINGSVCVDLKLDGVVGLSPGGAHCDPVKLPKSPDSEEVVEDKGSIRIDTGVKTRGRLSKEEKGKLKIEVEVASSSGTNTSELNIQNVSDSSVSGTLHASANESLPGGSQVRETDVNGNDAGRVHRERFRNFARRNASRFAHFSPHEEFGNNAPVGGIQIPVPEADNGLEDWPGPFSTAIKIINDGKRRGASTDKSGAVELKWIPKMQELRKSQKQVPSLQELCLSILAKNADAITSLDFVPDVLRHKICWFLCDNRKMDSHFLELLVHGSPTEIRVRDCSWLSEELFTKTFEGCNASKLTVFQFDQGGACLPDYTLNATLACSTNSLPALTTVSLKGAYRLSDAGLNMLVSAAPSLKSIDISQCPMLTSDGICSLANSLQVVLRELYIDNCHGIDAMSILPALLKLENLEVLSLAGIQTVCDDFVSKLVSIHGCRMKELVLADCIELTDSSIKVIGDTCSKLRAIDLSNLCKLTDISIGHLANGCRAIQMLKFCRNAFSDEAIAAYLDVRGALLNDLSLNNIIQVSNHTALSLARNCRNLRSLDLSWCRNLTNEALGLVVDSCSSLEVLKLFGCTQVTNVFLDGHSNSEVKLIGLKMTPVFKHIDVPDFLLGPLRYSSVSV